MTLTELHYSKATARPIRMVLAVAGDSPWQSVEDLPAGVRVHTEYPELTRRFLEKHGVDARDHALVRRDRGQDPRDRRRGRRDHRDRPRAARRRACRCSTRSSSRTPSSSRTRSRTPTPTSARRWSSCRRCCCGALEARGRVLVKLNVDEANLAAVIDLLPALKSPTVSKLFGEDGYAVETVVAKSDINMLDPRAEGRTARPASSSCRSPRSSSEPSDARDRSSAFDERRGLGEITGRRRHASTRSTAPSIADGTRTIAVGTAVEFEVVPGHLGRWEAAAIKPQR